MIMEQTNTYLLYFKKRVAYSIATKCGFLFFMHFILSLSYDFW